MRQRGTVLFCLILNIAKRDGPFWNYLKMKKEDLGYF